MSLSEKQKENTRRELRDNLNRSGVTVQEAAADLGTTQEYIMQLLRLEPKRLADTWILKNYLIDKVRKAGKTPTAFTALGGNYHIIWFLDSKYIDGGKIY